MAERAIGMRKREPRGGQGGARWCRGSSDPPDPDGGAKLGGHMEEEALDLARPGLHPPDLIRERLGWTSGGTEDASMMVRGGVGESKNQR